MDITMASIFPNIFRNTPVKTDYAGVEEPSVLPIAELQGAMKEAYQTLRARLDVVRSEQRRLDQLEFELSTALNAIGAGAKVLSEAAKVEDEVQITDADLDQIQTPLGGNL